MAEYTETKGKYIYSVKIRNKQKNKKNKEESKWRCVMEEVMGGEK